MPSSSAEERTADLLDLSFEDDPIPDPSKPTDLLLTSSSESGARKTPPRWTMILPDRPAVSSPKRPSSPTIDGMPIIVSTVEDKKVPVDSDGEGLPGYKTGDEAPLFVDHPQKEPTAHVIDADSERPGKSATLILNQETTSSKDQPDFSPATSIRSSVVPLSTPLGSFSSQDLLAFTSGGLPTQHPPFGLNPSAGDFPTPSSSPVARSRSTTNSDDSSPYLEEDYWSSSRTPVALDQVDSSWNNQDYGGGALSPAPQGQPWIMARGELVSLPMHRPIPFYSPARVKPVKITAPSPTSSVTVSDGTAMPTNSLQVSVTPATPRSDSEAIPEMAASDLTEREHELSPPAVDDVDLNTADCHGSDRTGSASPISVITTSFQSFSITPHAKQHLAIEPEQDTKLGSDPIGVNIMSSPSTRHSHVNSAPDDQAASAQLSRHSKSPMPSNDPIPRSRAADYFDAGDKPIDASNPPLTSSDRREAVYDEEAEALLDSVNGRIRRDGLESASTAGRSSGDIPQNAEIANEGEVQSREDIDEQSLGEIDEIRELGNLWEDYRDAYGQFSAGLEEVMTRLQLERESRLRATDGVASESPATAAGDLRNLAYQTQIRKMKDKLDEAEKQQRRMSDELNTMHEQLASARSDVDELLLDNESLIKERDTSNKRKDSLMHSYLLLEHELDQLKADGRVPQGPGFAVLFLEGSDALFNVSYVKDGYRGGKKAATRILEKVTEIIKVIKPVDSPTSIMVQLFLDESATRSAFDELGISRSTFREFLDGFLDAEDLVIIIDVPGQMGPAIKIRDHMWLYGGLQECQMLILAAGHIKPWPKMISNMSKHKAYDKLYAVRSTNDIDDDPFYFLGRDRLLYIDCLYTQDRQVVQENAHSITALTSRNAHDLEQISSRSLITTFTATESVPSTVSNLISIASSAKPNISTSAQGFIKGPQRALQQPPLTPPKEVKQAPWQDITAARPLHRQAESAQSTVLPRTGGSLLDQYQAMQSNRSQTTSPTPSDRTITGVRPRPALTIAWDAKIEGSIGGSPPSSDEDEPSVHLPHSAIKHVQRPPQFTSASPPPSSHASTFESDIQDYQQPQRQSEQQGSLDREGSVQSAGGSSRSRQRHQNRTRTIASSANSIPVAPRRPASTMSDLMDMESQRSRQSGMPQGFKWRDAQADYKVRRQSDEFKV